MGNEAMKHTPTAWAAAFTARAIVGFARVLTGVRALWHGRPPNEAPTVYFANHTSHGDFVLVWTALPPRLRARTRPVAAADYWQCSALRRFIGTQVFRALLIDRERRTPEDNTPDPVQQMAACLRAGESLILFPEGTRNTGDVALLPLKSGLFHLAQACPEARLVPVWIENLKRVLPKGSYVPVPLACSVDFGAPLALQADETKAVFLARARSAMLALRPDAEAEAEAEAAIEPAPAETKETPAPAR
jgi:1-acyl-sn-glycerol-3-phosphate acyltransferase